MFIRFLASRKPFRSKLNDDQTIIVTQRVIKCPTCFERKREETIASLKSGADNNADCRPSSAARLSVCFPDRPIRRRFFLTKDSSHRQKRNLPQFILQPISLCDCEIDDKSVLAAYRHYIVIILTQISCDSNGFYVEI